MLRSCAQAPASRDGVTPRDGEHARSSLFLVRCVGHELTPDLCLPAGTLPAGKITPKSNSRAHPPSQAARNRMCSPRCSATPVPRPCPPLSRCLLRFQMLSKAAESHAHVQPGRRGEGSNPSPPRGMGSWGSKLFGIFDASIQGVPHSYRNVFQNT
jgi:hypothetical protein